MVELGLSLVFGLGAAAVGVMLLVASIRPASASRIEGFAQRYGLDLTDQRQQAVARYLGLTRRCRTLGAVAGGLIGLIWTVPARKIDLIPLLTGWLAGAVLAEITLRARADGPADDRQAVPSWLTWLPAVLAGIATFSTAGSWWSHRADASAEPIATWGIGAVLVAALAAATNRYIARHITADPGNLAVDRAARAHSIAAVTSVSTMLVLLCLLGQLAVVRGGLFGQTAAAVNFIAAMWLFGALFWSIALWAAARPGASPRVAAALVIVLATGTLLGVGYGRWRDHPPYGPDAVHATAVVRFTDFEHFDADARALHVTDLNPPVNGPDQQTFVGRVDLVLPAGAAGDGSYHLTVIDRRTRTAAMILYGVDGGVSGGYLNEALRRYPELLAGLSPVRVGTGWSRPMMVSAVPAAGGPITFAGMLRPAVGLRPADVLIALIYCGPQQQVYWAVEVPTNAAL